MSFQIIFFDDPLLHPASCVVTSRHINSQKCPDGKTPLILAVESRSLPSVNQLIDCGASADIPDENGDTVFHYAARISGFGSQVVRVS